MKAKLLFLCLLLTGVLIISSCAGLESGTEDNQTAADNQTAPAEPSTTGTPEKVPSTPIIKEGWTKPRDLTQQEWKRAVQIALTVRELGQWLDKPYRTEMVWFVKTRTGWTVTSDPEPNNHDALGFYPGVSVSFNLHPKVVFDIAVDLDAGIPVHFKQSMVEEYSLPKYLTREEKAASIEIALRAVPPRYQVDPDKATFIWFPITSEGRQSGLDYNIVEIGLPANAPLNADYYPGVVFWLDSGHPIAVMVDLQNGKALEVLGPFPIPLTEEEEEKALQIASKAAGSTQFARFVWIGITSQHHNWVGFNYDNVDLGILYWTDPSRRDMTFYLGAIFLIEPAGFVTRVAIDLQNGTVYQVQREPNLSSPNRFKK